jgi:hypothetical protein
MLEAGRLRILNWPALATLGDFNPTYLHMDGSEAA